MGTSISEQLSQLPLLSTGLRVDMNLVENSYSFGAAAGILKGWIERKAHSCQVDPDFSLADTIIRKREFQLEWSTDSDSIAFLLSHSDQSHQGRTWIVEANLRAAGDKSNLQVRYAWRQPRNHFPPLPRAPKFICDMATAVGVTDHQRLRGNPERIGRDSFGSLSDILLSDRRRLPLVVISQDQRTGSFYADADKLAAHLCGVAHVYQIDTFTTFMLTELVGGNGMSVFHGGVRCYAPRFSLEDDSYLHKLWTREAIFRLDATRKDGFETELLNHVFSTVTAEFEPFKMPTPAELRRARTEREQSARFKPIPLSSTENETQSEPEEQAEQLILPDMLPQGTKVGRSLPAQVQYTVDSETGALELAGSDNSDAEIPFDALKRIENVYREAWNKKFGEMQAEIEVLNEIMRELRDENAQKTREILRLSPYEQQVQALQEENNLLRGRFESSDTPALTEFWSSVQLMIEAAQTVTLEAKRVRQQEVQIEQQEKEIHQLRQARYKAEEVARVRNQALDNGNELVGILPLESWEAMIHNSKAEHEYIIHAPYILDSLSDTPFDEGSAKGVLDLLSILNELGRETTDNGGFTKNGLEMYQKYFASGNTWFSDESEQNRRHFAKELSFPDPFDLNSRIECSWHGKLMHNRFRVHFEWPRPKGQREIKVVYIGQKITKH